MPDDGAYQPRLASIRSEDRSCEMGMNSAQGRTAAARQNVLAASRRSASSRARSLPTPHRQSVSRSGRLLPSPIRPGSFWRSTVTIFHSTDASHAEVSIRVQGSMQEARPDEQKGSGSRSCNLRRSAPWQQGLISKH